MLKNKHALIVITLLVGSCAGYFLFSQNPSPEDGLEKVRRELDLGTLDLPSIPLEETYPHVIPNNSTLFNVLRALDVPSPTIQEIVTATRPVFNLAQIHPGVRFQLNYDTLSGTQLTGLQFYFSPLEKLDIQRKDNTWVAKKIVEEVSIKVVTFSGTVTSSLWVSAVKAGMDPDLISDLADIFGWEVDFAREVKINDRWRISVEQKNVKNKPIGWGAILAAEYINAGEVHQAALFRLDGEDMGYYTPQGTSLRKVFLKSPIRYGRITSGFTRRRFHPILQIYRAHQGVDYGAPIGTPIRAVGDGTVTFAARNGGAGNVIKIRHNATYETAYKHLSGYAKGIRSGARVQQGQVIGFVGNTGLSTGPHLHFEFYQMGRYIDPLSKKFPSAEPVPSEHLAKFQTSAQTLLKSLPTWEAGSTDKMLEGSSSESRTPSNSGVSSRSD